MRLSISNIAWNAETDAQMYGIVRRHGFDGLEIAPTRIFPEKPYAQISQAVAWAHSLQAEYGLAVSSMQSIWYGVNQSIFSGADRPNLLDYTKKAIDFAKAIGCGNLVFGCPRNRVIPGAEMYPAAVAFFREIGDYAAQQGTCIGMEANPPIYNTNFINDTPSAIRLIQDVDSPGFLLNLDFGTVLYNEESLSELADNVKLINHIHISEPYLKPIQERGLHCTLRQLLKCGGYGKYVSIEMASGAEIDALEKTMDYVGRVFG